MKCETVPIKSRKICYGDLNKKIKLQMRSLTEPDDAGEYDYTQEFSNERTVWAAVQTISGKDIFDGTNVIGTATHVFYIKYISELTSEDMIEWQSEKYRILEKKVAFRHHNIGILIDGDNGKLRSVAHHGDGQSIITGKLEI